MLQLEELIIDLWSQFGWELKPTEATANLCKAWLQMTSLAQANNNRVQAILDSLMHSGRRWSCIIFLYQRQHAILGRFGEIKFVCISFY